METVFKGALQRRRRQENLLTSTLTNAIHYGSPAFARKRDIWPPLSSLSGLKGSDDATQEMGRSPLTKLEPLDQLTIQSTTEGTVDVANRKRSFDVADFGELPRANQESGSASALSSKHTSRSRSRSYSKRRFRSHSRGSPSLSRSQSRDSRSRSLGRSDTQSRQGSLSPEKLESYKYAEEFEDSDTCASNSETSQSGGPPYFQPPSDTFSDQTSDQNTETDTLYSPLYEGKTIRVLILYPADFKDPLIGDFSLVDMQQPDQEFEALSYVWNASVFGYDRTIKPTISFAGHPKEITANLENALKHIRSSTEPKCLWVDALCINQADNTERSHQVTLMSLIYSSASRVIVWVGELTHAPNWWFDERKGRHRRLPKSIEDVRAKRAFGGICEVVNRWQAGRKDPHCAEYWVPSPENPNQRDTFSTFDELPLAAHEEKYRSMLIRYFPSSFDTYDPYRLDQSAIPDFGLDSSPDTARQSQLWLALEELFSKSWFWRVWIIQEVVLAKVAVVKWANTEIDWRWVGLAAAILRTQYHTICDKLQMSGVYNAYLLFRLSRLSDLPPLQVPFIQLLRLTRQFEVTDPRDRVYGLLGMKTAGNDPTNNAMFLDPDYSITEVDLWKRLAWKVIRELKNLTILSSVQYTTTDFDIVNEIRLVNRSGSGQPLRLPSWVPNWQTVYRSTLAAWDLEESFAAARGLDLDLGSLSHETSDTLRVQGIKAGVIGYTGYYMWHDVDTSFFLLEHLGPFFVSDAGLALLARTFTAGRDEYGSLTAPSDTQALHDFAAYILMLHSHHNRKTDYSAYEEIDYSALGRRKRELRRSKNFKPVFKKHPGFRERLQLLASTGYAERFRASAIAVCERRRLFLTLDGFLGVGPDNLHEGDVVTVLAGGSVPFLLRAKTTGSEHNLGALPPISLDWLYTLVGECYVEGLMDGEAVTAMNSTPRGPVPVELILQEIIHLANLDHSDTLDYVHQLRPFGSQGRNVPRKQEYSVGNIKKYATSKFQLETICIQ